MRSEGIWINEKAAAPRCLLKASLLKNSRKRSRALQQVRNNGSRRLRSTKIVGILLGKKILKSGGARRTNTEVVDRPRMFRTAK